MNSNMIRPINETEDFLLSVTKICETLIEQTHRKTEETLDIKLTNKNISTPTTYTDWRILDVGFNKFGNI